MIPVEKLIYGIDYKLNSLSNLKNRSIFIEDKILALNEAQILLVKTKIGLSNNYQLGLDAFKKRYHDLQILIESFEGHKLIPVEANTHLNKWVVALKDLPNFMFYIDAYVLADKGKCKNRKITVNNDLAKHADVQTLLSNSNYIPSFEYQETFNTISGDNLEVYTDGTFTPKEIYTSYLRYPIYIDAEGYDKLDGSGPSVNQDCELPDYLYEELVNFAVSELAKITENIPAVQLTAERKKLED